MTTKAPARRCWLFKSEPETFSLADLARAKTKGAFWDGVRNYQARNFLRDDVQVGDAVLFYHSSAEPPHVAGTAVVVRGAEPDPTQFDPADPHYDPKSRRDAPPWVGVVIRHEATFRRPVSRDDLAADPVARTLDVLKRGNRLSIQSVTPEQFEAVVRLGGRPL